MTAQLRFVCGSLYSWQQLLQSLHKWFLWKLMSLFCVGGRFTVSKVFFNLQLFFFYFLETETVSFHFVVLVWMREFFALNLVLCQTDEKTEYDYTLTASTAATISPLKERFFAFLRWQLAGPSLSPMIVSAESVSFGLLAGQEEIWGLSTFLDFETF